MARKPQQTPPISGSAKVGQGGIPADIPEVLLPAAELDSEGRISGLGLLKALKLCATTSEAIRLIDGGESTSLSRIEKTRIESGKELLPVKDGMIVRAGRKGLSSADRSVT